MTKSAIYSFFKDTKNLFSFIQMRENMKKILVTGGAGFIGSHLIESSAKTEM